MWPHIREGAQLFYLALKKMEFSAQNYKELLSLYERILESKSAPFNSGENVGQSGLETPKKVYQHLEAEVLHEVACTWLNRVVKVSENTGAVTKNYDRWSTLRVAKQKLKIGGIFPMSGDKYRAPELVPGEQALKYK